MGKRITGPSKLFKKQQRKLTIRVSRTSSIEEGSFNEEIGDGMDIWNY